MSDRCASSCRGKIRYTSQRRAAAAAKESQIKFGVPMNEYECGFCKNWHVGNTLHGNAKRYRQVDEGVDGEPELE